MSDQLDPRTKIDHIYNNWQLRLQALKQELARRKSATKLESDVKRINELVAKINNEF